MKNAPIKDNQLDRTAAAGALREFLAEMIRAGGFRLTATVRALPVGTTAEEGEPEVFADVVGPDQEILLERGGDVLKSLEHLAYRALRFEELRMTARLAAERVQASRQSFQLNPMSSRERRIVHLALKEIPGVRTESVGTGDKRQVVIHPAAAKSSASR